MKVVIYTPETLGRPFSYSAPDPNLRARIIHPGARPEHALWQGKRFSLHGDTPDYPNLAKATGYGAVTGLKGAHCHHDFNPVIPGLSQPAYTAEELDRLNNPPPITYEGRKYTFYQATQKQRQIERSICQSKRRCMGYQAAGLESDYTAESVRLRRLNELYADFSEKTGLIPQRERTMTAGWGRSESAKAVQTAKREKLFQNLLEKARKSDTISVSSSMETYLAEQPFERLRPLEGKLSNRAVRKWYIARDQEIPLLIDRTKPLEQQARQACELRILHRTQARNLMADKEERARLERDEKSKRFEELLEDKMTRKHLSREKAVEDILRTAAKTRKFVNEQLEVE